jgi:BON domain
MNDDIYIAGDIERALASDPRTHELGIRAEARPGVIVLHGEVATAERRLLVTQVAAEVAHGMIVRNEVTITAVLPPEFGS